LLYHDYMKELNTISGFFFDTTNSILCDVDEPFLKEAIELCSHYEKLLSRFVAGSDMWRINHSKGELVPVSSETLELLACAEKIRIASEGAFDIAMGSISKLWDFTGKNGGIRKAPEKERLVQAQQLVKQTIIKVEGNCVAVPQGATLDLGGIAKGYICDRIAEFLRKAGATSGYLNFGGNVVTIGLHPEKRPWQVGIQAPSAQRGERVFAVVESSNSAVVTSGVYERAFLQEGMVYHHILDPETGLPAKSNLLSATVVMSDGMLADALSTALLVLGAEKGIPFINSFCAEAITLDANGHVHTTPNLKNALCKNPIKSN